MTQKHLVRRRRFLALSAAGLAVPVVLPRCVFGQASQSAPSERITLGLIGMGKQNRYHLSQFLRTDQVHVLAVCDVDTTRREHAKKMVEDRYAEQRPGYKGCAAYNDYRELVARDDIDAVVIGTPDHWHIHPIVDACKARKDVYCEKPLTLTIAEAKLAIDAVRKYDVVFQTGSQQRSSREFRFACELVRNGRIGKIVRVEAAVGGPSRWCDLPEEPLEPGLDWNMWLGQAPMRPYNSVLSPRGVHDHFPAWRAYREYSGGGMTDWGAHHFDIAQWGLDMDQSGPVEIIPPEEPNATSGVRFVYANGIELIHGGPGGVHFVGTEGEIFVNRGKLASKPESIIEQPIGEGEIHLYESPGHHRDWLDCIRSRKRPICDVEIGARSVTVCHLGNLVYWNRRPLRWDPANWEFPNDEEANSWRDRTRRDPWQLPSLG